MYINGKFISDLLYKLKAEGNSGDIRVSARAEGNIPSNKVYWLAEASLSKRAISFELTEEREEAWNVEELVTFLKSTGRRSGLYHRPVVGSLNGGGLAGRYYVINNVSYSTDELVLEISPFSEDSAHEYEEEIVKSHTYYVDRLRQMVIERSPLDKNRTMNFVSLQGNTLDLHTWQKAARFLGVEYSLESVESNAET